MEGMWQPRRPARDIASEDGKLRAFCETQMHVWAPGEDERDEPLPEEEHADMQAEEVTALRYRVGKKQLLRAIAGAPPACAATSAFAIE